MKIVKSNCIKLFLASFNCTFRKYFKSLLPSPSHCSCLTLALQFLAFNCQELPLHIATPWRNGRRVHYDCDVLAAGTWLVMQLNEGSWPANVLDLQIVLIKSRQIGLQLLLKGKTQRDCTRVAAEGREKCKPMKGA